MQTGKLQAKVLRDVEQIEMLVRMLVENLLNVMFIFSSAVIIASLKEPLMLAAFAIIIPITTVVVRMFKRPIKQRNSAFRQQVEAMSARVTESLATHSSCSCPWLRRSRKRRS